MAKGLIRIVSTVPGPRNLDPLVREFCNREGTLTALSDSAVRSLAAVVSEDAGIEAIPFGSLVRRFASLCGEMPLPVAHAGHGVAAIGAACQDLPFESPFGRVARMTGFHKALAETLHELSEHGLCPETYEHLADQDPTVADKLRSLALVEQEAAESLRLLGRSFGREHYRLCESGSPERGAELGRIFVLAGSEFNPAALRVLQWAARNGAQVTIAVYRHAKGQELFKGASQTVAELGLTPELTGTSNALLDRLFGEEAATSAGDIRCSVVSTPDPLAEAEWALRGCLERHAQGIAYEKMALYVRNAESYAPLIDAAARRLGVPIRMWRRAPLLTNSFARVTQAALEFCASDDVRSLSPIIRTSYLSLGHELRQELHEALSRAHSTRAEQWRTLREWAAERTESFPWLDRILDWREEALASSTGLEGWIGRLRDLMLLLPGEGSREPVLFGKLPPAMGGPGQERDKRAIYVLQQSLNQVASIRRLQNLPAIGLGEFGRIARTVWSEADVSVPASETGVQVTSRADGLPDVEALFVLGMLEGVFPRRRSEDPILSDIERDTISRLRGGSPLPNSRDRAEAERDEFYQLCAATSKELILSYPETDEERDNVPAFYLDEVERALGGVDRATRSRKALVPEDEACLSPSDREIGRALAAADREAPLPLELLPQTRDEMAPDAELGFKPRELREAALCPFSYFAKRILGISPHRMRTRWFSLVALPSLARLAQAEDPATAQSALEGALEEQLDKLYSEIPEWEISLLRSGGERLIREWVEREFEARRLWPKQRSRSGPAFGQDGLRRDLPKGVRLAGKVAGMSEMGPYSVVHLTETSGPARGYGSSGELADPDKLFYGVHLLAAWGKNQAVAVEVETMGGERLLILLPRVAGANLAANVQHGLKVLDLGGGEGASGARGFFEDVKALAEEAAQRIRHVSVQATPGEHCEWCDFAELCRRAQRSGEEDSPFASF